MASDYPALMMQAKLSDMGKAREMFTEEDEADFRHMCSMIPKMVTAGVLLCVGDDFGTSRPRTAAMLGSSPCTSSMPM